MTECSLGIKCAGVDYSQLCPNSTSAGLGLLATARFADPAIAKVLTATAAALPDMFSLLGLSNLDLLRALNGWDNAGMPEGHGSGRGHLGVCGTVGSGQKRSEDVVPYGSSIERFVARKRAHRRGASAALNKDAQGQCLTTS